MLTVLVCNLMVGLLFSFTRFFGYRVAVLAALAMASRPGLFFYERYASHETWLVFFLILTFWGFLGWHYRVAPASVWATVLGITGMMLTKETYAIHLVAFVAAAFVAWAISKIVRGTEPESPAPIKVPWQTFTIGTLVSWPIFAVGFGLIWFFISHATVNAATVASDEPGEVGGPTFVQGLALCVFLGMAIAIPIAILLSRQASIRSDDGNASVNFPCLPLFCPLLLGHFLPVSFYRLNFLTPRVLLGIFETFKTWTKTGVDSAGHGKPTYDLF